MAVKSNNKQSMKHDNRHITRSRKRPSKLQITRPVHTQNPDLSSRDDKVTQMKHFEMELLKNKHKQSSNMISKTSQRVERGHQSHRLQGQYTQKI